MNTYTRRRQIRQFIASVRCAHFESGLAHTDHMITAHGTIVGVRDQWCASRACARTKLDANTTTDTVWTNTSIYRKFTTTWHVVSMVPVFFLFFLHFLVIDSNGWILYEFQCHAPAPYVHFEFISHFFLPWKRRHVPADAAPSVLPARLYPRTCVRDTSASRICCRPPRTGSPSVNSLWKSERNRGPANFSVLDGFCCCWNSRRCLCCSCNRRLNLSASMCASDTRGEKWRQNMKINFNLILISQHRRASFMLANGLLFTSQKQFLSPPLGFLSE